LICELEISGVPVNSKDCNVVASGMQDVHEITIRLLGKMPWITAASPHMPRIQHPAVGIDIEGDDTVAQAVGAIKKVAIR
jgi:hypothetical protein